MRMHINEGLYNKLGDDHRQAVDQKIVISGIIHVAIW